jgi:uncharacterized repeat protein (TIGR01451 family)
MKRKTRRFKSAFVAVSLIVLAFPAFAPSAGAADPTPPFAECPAAGHATSCNVLIVFNADGTVGIFQGQPTRLDNDEDTLVGVRNSSGSTVPNAILSSTDPNIHPYAFDGDGMCSTAPRSAPRPAGCPYQTSGTGADYAGPGITYTNINAAQTSGTVNFAQSCTQTTTCTPTPTGLSAGSTVFFSLEDKVDAGNIVVEGGITATKTASPNPANVGQTVTYTINLSNTGSVAKTTDVTDDYDETHITIVPNSISTGGVNDSPSAGMIKWTGVSVPPGANTVTLTYQGTVTGSFSGDHGICGTGFPVINTVTLSNGTGTTNTLCVNNGPSITSVKTASKTSADVGDTVTYTIKLSNSGGSTGTTDVVDDYDEAHLDVTNISSGGVNDSPSAGKIKWSAVSVPVGTDTATLTYDATIHGPFSGGSGTCPTGQFPVINTVTVSGGTGTLNTICVTVPIVMTGRAYGLSLSLLDSPLIVPTADTGAISTSNDSVTKECALALPIPSDPGYLINIELLCGKVTTTKATHTSLGEASIAHVTLVIPGLPVIDIGAIESNSTTTCAGSEGHTIIASLKLDGEEQLPQDIIPENTDIPLGIGDLFLNEQIPFTSPDKGLTVNAVHLAVPGIIDLVLASSESDITGCP